MAGDHHFPRRLLTAAALVAALVTDASAAGSLPIRVAAAPPAPNADVPAVADLNGDTFGDLAVLTRKNRSVALFFGSAAGLPAAPAARLLLANAPRDLALGDFDADGITDIAVLVTPGAVSVFLGNGAGAGDGTFAAPVTTLLPGASVIAAAPLRGAGAPHDLIAARPGAHRQLVVLSSNGDGTFDVAEHDLGTRVKPGARLLVADVGTSGSNNTRDGLADVLIHVDEPGRNVTRAFLRYGDGLGGLALALPVTTFLSRPGPLVNAEQTGDGCNDLVSTGFASGGTGPPSAVVWRIDGRCNGDGAGAFQSGATGRTQPGGRIVDALGTALDGDAEEEVVLVSDRSDMLGILDMSGALATRQECPVGARPRSVAAGDFNGDGAVDLATANGRGGDVTVLSGPTSVSCGTTSTLNP